MENQIVSSSHLGSPWGKGYGIHVCSEEAASWGNLGGLPCRRPCEARKVM